MSRSRTSDRPDHRLAYPDSRFTRLAGIDVHHEVHGRADTPAILFSHHFYGSVPTWKGVMDELSDDHLVAAFDRPGFGLTERPRRRAVGGVREPYSRETAARIGWELLDHLEIERAVLVGSSAGGTNVLEMYAQQPDRVRGLVLISAAVTGDIGPPAGVRPLLRNPVLRPLAGVVARKLAADITVERISRSWHDPSRATTEHAEPYQRMLQVDGWERGFWELVNAEPPPDLRRLLGTIESPTLVVAGGSDRIIGPAANRRTARAIPGARFELLPSVGHTPQEEDPAALVAVMRRFLADLPT